MSNQRAFARVSPRLGAPVEVHVMGGGFLEVLKARDVSEGGIGIFVPHQFNGCDIRQALDLLVALPGEKAFLCKGTIRHKQADRGAHFGIEFTEIAPDSLERLRAYIRARLTEGLR